MRVLVLGGNGFIGSHIVDKLLSSGHKVRVFDRSPEQYRVALRQVEYRLGSFDDISQVAEALDGVDVVCHLISTTVPSTSNMNPVEDVKSNLLNTLQLLEEMRKKGLHRILYLSSGGTIYGNPKCSPVSEDHALNPISSYGIVKMTIEKYLYMYQQLHGFRPVILRPSNPYGSRQRHAGVQGLIGIFLAKILAKEKLEIWGDGSIVRDYVHVNDLANLCVAAIESEICGVYNAGSGEGYTINEVVAEIRGVINEPFDVIYRSGRLFDVKEVVLDIRRATTSFGWRPEVSLNDGIQDQLHWLRSL